MLASQIAFSVALLLIGLSLYWIGMPNKQGVNPRFLQFEAAQVIYPVIALAFVAIGLAGIIATIGGSRF